MPFRPFRCSVHSVRQLSPHFLRVTFTGPDLVGLVPSAPVLDLRIKLIFPGPDNRLPDLPDGDDWYRCWSELPAGQRGHMRTYSVRDFVRQGPDAFLTVDFVLHLAAGATGPASLWARDARPGDPALAIGPTAADATGAGVEFTPGDATELRLIGDETAAPAIARILRDLPAGSCGAALIEVPTAADQLDLDAPAGMSVTWFPREGAPHGQLLLDSLAVTSEPTQDGGDLIWETPGHSSSGEPLDTDGTDGGATYYWIAGESGMVTTLRRHLVKTRGVSRSRVSFMGYWKRGVAMRG